MTRRRTPAEFIKENRRLRDHALSRIELGQPTSARVSAKGAISAPIKAKDPEVEKLIAEFEAKNPLRLESDRSRK